MAKKIKYYAVVKGRIPGIYTEWTGPNGAQAQVIRFPGAAHAAFGTRKEAEMFIATGGIGTADKEAKGTGASEKEGDVSQSDKVVIYTDGACTGNPGPGGYGVILRKGKYSKELSAGYRLTTNNRMELLACIIALRALKQPSSVILHSDSRYVVDSMTKGWARSWRSKGWIKSDRKPALNADLWDELLQLDEIHDVEYRWVKGHAGNEHNERCDVLATEAAKKDALFVDSVYENKGEHVIATGTGG